LQSLRVTKSLELGRSSCHPFAAKELSEAMTI